MPPIKTQFTDAIGPKSVPTSATHSPAATTDTSIAGLPARTSGHGGFKEVTVVGVPSGKPKTSGPVDTAFNDTVN